jgi:two-component system chemotaxis response regulator CheB
MIEVLVVDDSPVVREYLCRVLAADPAIQVVGTANDGDEAVAFVQRRAPTVVTMDVDMPRMDGFEATRRIMATRPVPIVIATGSWDRKAVTATMQALKAGAVTAIGKPRGLGDPEQAESARRFVETVKLMSEVKVVRQWSRPRVVAAAVPATPAGSIRPAAPIRLVAIGASTGGPPVLQSLLAALPASFPVPVLIVQHIASGFIDGMAEWLQETTRIPVHVAAHGERLLSGHAYLAPDGRHLGIESAERALLSESPAENNLRPAVSFLFRSVARTLGPRAIGVMLTGMGRDGALELRQLRDTGALTIAQNRETSVVHGMPGEAIALGGASHVLAPADIASMLIALTQASKSTGGD